MRSIDCAQITETVAQLAIEANYVLGADVKAALRQALERGSSPQGKQVLEQLLENAEIAEQERVPMCQDTGYAVVFLELGQEAHIIGGYLYDAVQEGIRRGYREGYLRKSIVAYPFTRRANTKDNTPAVIHTEIVPGDSLKITVVPKGAGSENMSRLFMLIPAEGVEGIKRVVVRAVDEAGPNPCPPVIVGVGIGGTAEMVMLLAKKALLRPLGEPNPDPEMAALEHDLGQAVNALGIGPAGFGGRVTALAVHVESFPAHIASLPVGVNIQCNAARHKSIVL
ncbi:MAG: fumarate hydratase [Chloroflexi bacterium]|nr:fumarate hydratase [Chloroflexota bacterium]MCL5074807.1 fumarate hydratase [Chloroflexota bacterium]